jgi:2-hydroxychromene-2-carboxylate isomerase
MRPAHHAKTAKREGKAIGLPLSFGVNFPYAGIVLERPAERSIR